MNSIIIDHNDVIISTDRAWDEFADSNGAPELFGEDIIGASLWEVMRNPQAEQLYRAIHQAVRNTGQPVRISYRCDSPIARRDMVMEISRISEDLRLEITNSVISEQPLEQPFHFAERKVTAPHQVLRCSMCSALNLGAGWQALEAALANGVETSPEQPLSVVHRYCPSCLERLKSSAVLNTP